MCLVGDRVTGITGRWTTPDYETSGVTSSQDFNSDSDPDRRTSGTGWDSSTGVEGNVTTQVKKHLYYDKNNFIKYT